MFFENNPFDLVFKAFEQLYPGKVAKIYFEDTDQYKAYGVTFFGDNLPIIHIDPDYSVRKATEVLIHELAHVAAGYGNNHNEVWKDAENKIKNKYLEIKG